VRWPAKTSGAFGFGCPFLCFFLLSKQKKERQNKNCIRAKNKAEPLV
jgi:hypothetical protein